MDVLVLNASYEVLNITRWQRAICLVFSGKAEMLEQRDRSARSQFQEFDMPSVIKMNYYVKKPRMQVPFSRGNVFMRDHHTCQYCGKTRKAAELTLDHIMPRSLGGETCWENLVTACKHCNVKKGNRTPEAAGMKLRKTPRAPQFTPTLQACFREDWEKYVPYAVPLSGEIN
ncbi:MAG TPA: HNH endonuclease [bacterium]|nr:HNH endonuclease [bacterium]HPI76790.1 HNH endonuclease [bacterium]